MDSRYFVTKNSSGSNYIVYKQDIEGSEVTETPMFVGSISDCEAWINLTKNGMYIEGVFLD